MTHEYIKGKIIKGIGGFYYILIDEQRESAGSFLYKQKNFSQGDGFVLEAKARGVLRHQKIKPVVGDIVQVYLDGEGAIIEKIETRKNLFVRPPVANVDIALIVMAATDPKPNLMLLDKLLVMAEFHQVQPVIVLTKNDLVSEEESIAFNEIYSGAGYPMMLLSNNDKDQFEDLRKILGGKTAFLAGPSGVGKSTLANRFCQTAEMETGDLSKRLGRGRHTTRHVELLELEKGTYLLDTPGFSSLELDDDFTPETLKWYFIEFPQGECRFSTCAHRHEPGCAVRSAFEEGRIAPSRYENYSALYEWCVKRCKK